MNISMAPMMGYTDRHARYLFRLLSPHVQLYTEMVTTGALLYGDRARFLEFHPNEHPITLQLGGNDPKDLADCARFAEAAGYDEVNLNIGCPSERVQSGRLGVCLMKEPNRVAECISAMSAAVKIPVTVKCRIGVDDFDSYAFLTRFIECVAQAGCHTFIIHARKAWLQGLSPKENREIPPISYPTVWSIKRDFPQLTIIVNGGIKTLTDIDHQSEHVDGVMIGREIYNNPSLLLAIEERYFNTPSLPSKRELIEQWVVYIEQQLHLGVKLSSMVKHGLNLFKNEKGARIWRRQLTEKMHLSDAKSSILWEIFDFVQSITEMG